MEDNIKIKGEIDAGFTSYFDPEKHKAMSETIDATTDDDLHSEETTALPAEVDEEGLTLPEKNIIEAAVRNKDMTTRELAEEIDKHRTYIGDVLREKCPEWYNDVFKANGNSTSVGMDTPAKIKDYVRSNNGVTRADITDALGISESTFYKYIDDVDGIRSETNVNGYHGRTNVYYADEKEETPTEKAETVEMTRIGDDEPVESFGDELANQSVESNYSELQAVIAGMKATAEYEETVRALEVVEGYL